MSTQVQIRRSDETDNVTFVGARSEVTHDMPLRSLRIHDGETPGGNRTLMESERGVAGGIATLDENGAIPEAQLSNAYAAIGEFIGVTDGIASLDSAGSIPASQLGNAYSAIEESLGVAGGIATLDNTGNIPISQLGNVQTTYDYTTTAEFTAAEVPAGITYIRTAGYNTASDGGGGLWVRSTTHIRGDQMVINGGFNSDSSWSKSGGWSISGGVATNSGSPAGGNLSQTLVLIPGLTYELVFTVSGYVQGNVLPTLTGGTSVNGTAVTANGTYTQQLVAVSVNTDPTSSGAYFLRFFINPRQDEYRQRDFARRS